MLSPTSLLNTFLIHFTYLALIVLLVVAGTGVPLPEDIPLITAGYLCNKHESPIAKANLEDLNHDGTPDHRHRHVPNIELMMVAGMIGVLLGDSIVFSLGCKGLDADNFVARHLRKVMHSKRREKVARHFRTHGNLTVFAGRFMPGFRGIIFAFAGMSKMSYARFLTLDGLAAAISVPVFIMLGHYFADRINVVLHFIDHVKHIVLPVAAVLIVGAIVLVRVRKRRAAAVVP
jgi:membrane protein DedA with SNARE-associated domain